MRRKTDLPELLCPAGSMEALYAAVEGGADAVYVGGKRFGARAFAKNFELEELKTAAAYCHLHGVRLFVAVNTLIYDKELEDAYLYCRELYKLGADALIVCDIGLISLLRDRLPDFELHASTQMGVHNKDGADMAYSMGLGRAVLARECSGEDIQKICEESLAECEVFVHGALCVCHSGQCLFSSMVGGRSGNRGECAQPCRLPFGKGYPLSLKDLSLAKHIPELIDMGVASLKIEGRMKSPDYVYRVARIFRALLDGRRAATDSEMAELAEIFSRGGFTDGYFKGKPASKMTGVRSDADKQITKEQSGQSFIPMRAGISMEAKIRLGEQSSLTASLTVRERCGDTVKELSVSALGNAAEPARSAPLTKESVEQRLGKLGGSPFVLDGGALRLTLDEGVNLSPSELNSLRRTAVELLCEELAAPIRPRVPSKSEYDFAKINRSSAVTAPRLSTATFYNSDTAKELLSALPKGLFDIAFLPLTAFATGWERDTQGIGVCIPPVLSERELDGARSELKAVRELGVKYALVSNIGHIRLARELGFSPVGDFRLNVSNRLSRAFFRLLGLEYCLLSPELTLPMARDIGGGVAVQGRIPLMLTERCFISESFGCDKCGKAGLTDRYGETFPMLREYRHRNQIFNSQYTYMGDKLSELDSARINHRHFIFSTETPSQARKMMLAYKNGERILAKIRRIGRR